MLSALVHQKIINEIDLHFSRFIDGISGNDDPWVSLAAALASRVTADGNLCLEFKDLAGQTLFEDMEAGRTVTCPPLDQWRSVLGQCSAVGKPGEYRPLILDETHRLYLYRYWEYEHRLAENIFRKMNNEISNVDVSVLRQSLDRLFPEERTSETDWQRVAAAAACFHRFCVITGGPGTGKTTTLARVLAAMVESGMTGKERISLTAPTGKAAARIGDAVRRAKAHMNTSDEIKALIPDEAKTIHRFLGAVQGSPYFRHSKENPVSIDILVVDEASMMDVPLASKLFAALPEATRVILTGDENQLASVAPGAVLGDICNGFRSGSFSEAFIKKIRIATGQEIVDGLPAKGTGKARDHWIQLKKSFRFSGGGAIEALGKAINKGRSEDAMAMMKDGENAEVQWQDLEDESRLYGMLKEFAGGSTAEISSAKDPESALALLEKIRILCAVNEGPYGVRNVNRLAERLAVGSADRSGKAWYKGRPVMIMRNDYGQGLFNGDMGISWPDTFPGQERFYVFFPGNGVGSKISPIRLPAHETAFAVTVHKSQGSEFDNILLILPDSESPVLTRELLYTAVTRAKQSVTICGKPEIFRYALSRKIVRGSGLRDALFYLPKSSSR